MRRYREYGAPLLDEGIAIRIGNDVGFDEKGYTCRRPSVRRRDCEIVDERRDAARVIDGRRGHSRDDDKAVDVTLGVLMHERPYVGVRDKMREPRPMCFRGVPVAHAEADG
ncbi:MAG TPA: hypothetical protein VH419_12790 [Nocardioidaceae bacterium]